MMVIYFSGTGNSKFAAKIISGIVNDELINAGAMLKCKQKNTFFSKKPFVIVCPTYAWRIPTIFENFINRSDMQGSKNIYFILTCGSDTGCADRYAQSFCEKRGLKFMGLSPIVMPENYTAMFPVPDRQEATLILKKAVPEIEKAARLIKSNKFLPQRRHNITDRLKSGIINKCFYAFCVHAKGFYATNTCTGCGKCAALCPLENITLKSVPEWNKKCTHCMACINACPAGAIQYKNKTQSNNRYYLDG